MSGLTRWWAEMWPQVFPNLIASLIWGPIAAFGLWVYHRCWSKRHAMAMHEKLDLIARHVHLHWDDRGVEETIIEKRVSADS